MGSSNAQRVREVVSALKLKLPDAYVQYLESLNEPKGVRFGGESWWLMTAERLVTPYELNGWTGVPFAHAIRQFIRMHQVGKHTIMELIKSDLMSLEELSGCISIGEGVDGGALLMINPVSGAICAYVDDGWMLNRYASSFGEFIAKCVPY